MNNEIIISNHTPQDITITQDENQLIFINGGGEVIGVTDVKVNGTSVVTNNIAYVIVPTLTSQLTNDSGYITTETDPTVPSYVKTITRADINSWNNKQDLLVSGSNIKTINNTSLLGSGNIDITGGTSYSAGTGISIENNIISNTITNYNDLTDLPTIPNKTSDLINDEDFVSEDELAEVALTGSYNSLSDTPIIPSATSELTNDSDFITSSEVSTEIQTAISTKQDTLVSGTNIKTINSNSLLGSGNVNITSNTVTFNGGWIPFSYVPGGDYLCIIPFNNPTLSTPTFNLTSSEYYTPGNGWQTCTISLFQYSESFVVLRCVLSSTNTNLLMRMYGTLTL